MNISKEAPRALKSRRKEGKKMEGLRDDCHRCIIFRDGKENREIIRQGTLKINGEEVPWIVIESNPKAMIRHFVFTTPAHHIGPEEVEARSLLNGLGTRLCDTTYRILNNSGAAASEQHYHLHITGKTTGERYSSGVANVMKIIQQDLPFQFPYTPAEVIAWLDKQLLQQS